MKKALLLLSAVAALSNSVQAQSKLKCGTDDVNNWIKQLNPNVEIYEQQLKAAIDEQLKGMDFSKFKTTSTFDDNTILHIPVVFHIVHDYGTENVSDDYILTALQDINEVFSKTNASRLNTIPTFSGNIPGTNIPYIGNAHIQFHLAQKDPNGNPTKGITRRRSYLTRSAGNQAKGDQWSPASYLNIWIIRQFNANHSNAGAFAISPASAKDYPYYYYDGVICLSQQMIFDHTLSHELAHSLNISHTWGATNDPEVDCFGSDDVDDTPPTKGHKSCGPDQLADSVCSTNGYEITYTNSEAYNLFGDSSQTSQAVTINYPDIANTQNIMDYSNCATMFTYLQTVRMRALLRSDIASRDSLVQKRNLVNTGVMDAAGAIRPRQDLPPIADFSTNTLTDENAFLCINTPNTFTNRSWNDTVTSANWTFTDGSGNVINKTDLGSTSVAFTNSGWVKVQLDVTSNAGTGTITKDSAVFVNSGVPVNARGFFQEFNPTDDLTQYPIFNIYKNQNKWSVVNNAGFFDKTSICMNAYDKRMGSQVFYNTPIGDVDEFYTPAFDFTSFASSPYLNLSFMISGASTTGDPKFMNDELEIHYRSTCSGIGWLPLTTLKKTDLQTVGVVNGEFVPDDFNDWKNFSYALPSDLKTSNEVYFRFRYKSGGNITDALVYPGTGNNVYIDRINFNESPTGVDDTKYQNKGIALAPNPTTGGSAVMIKGTGNPTNAKVQVTDVTGKVIYSTEAKVAGNTKIEIPANYISVKGIYMVNVLMDTKTFAEKLVVY